jgi:hypothetical protein
MANSRANTPRVCPSSFSRRHITPPPLCSAMLALYNDINQFIIWAYHLIHIHTRTRRLHFDIRAAARRRLLGGSALLLMLLLLLVLLERLLLFLFRELLSLSLLPRTEKQTIGSSWTWVQFHDFPESKMSEE